MAKKTRTKSGMKSSAEAAASAANDWTLTILVPTAKIDEDDVQPGPETKLHAKGVSGWLFGTDEEEVDWSDVKQQWAESISGIVTTISEWTSAQSDRWQVEEVTFGLTLSAKGKLLFIAEASTQGSVQVKLKRVAGARK